MKSEKLSFKVFFFVYEQREETFYPVDISQITIADKNNLIKRVLRFHEGEVRIDLSMRTKIISYFSQSLDM